MAESQPMKTRDTGRGTLMLNATGSQEMISLPEKVNQAKSGTRTERRVTVIWEG
jgi:hypothetical protein